MCDGYASIIGLDVRQRTPPGLSGYFLGKRSFRTESTIAVSSP
jgi:hypothetical protein